MAFKRRKTSTCEFCGHKTIQKRLAIAERLNEQKHVRAVQEEGPLKVEKEKNGVLRPFSPTNVTKIQIQIPRTRA